MERFSSHVILSAARFRMAGLFRLKSKRTGGFTSRECARRKASTQTVGTSEHRNQTKRPLRVFGYGLGLGASGLLTYHWTNTVVTFDEPIPYQKSVHFYRKMPLRAVSRIWGKVNNIDLPRWLRKPALMLYVWLFGCNLKEAAIEDLRYYHNLGEFFRRELKPSARPVDSKHCITSPADGKVLHFGVVENGKLEQVKGLTYRLDSFLGQPEGNSIAAVEPAYNPATLLRNKDNELYHCIFYLAPGDYHRFHSPVPWVIESRKHFPGNLLSVSPTVAKFVKGLFNYNERAVYTGRWKHGFFSMTAVGATNVGSIRVYCDDELKTNYGKHDNGVHFHRSFIDTAEHGITMAKGELFGEFNLGSSIVLVFEAPKDFKFKIWNGQKIKYGEPIGLDDNDEVL